MQEFVEYKRKNNRDDLKQMLDLFDENKILYQLDDNSIQFDASFANNTFNKEYIVKILPDSFDEADFLLKELALTEIEHIDSSYYLYQFSTGELLEILEKQDEWNEFDILLAERLLQEKGHSFSPEELMLKRQKRNQLLAEPEKDQDFWLVMGYLGALTGGIFGIILGWNFYFQQKTLPNGERIDAHTKFYRKHGLYMLVIGIPIFILAFILAFYDKLLEL